MKVYNGIANENLLNTFSDINGLTLMNHVANTYNIDMAIGFAALFCPAFVEIENCVFIKEFYNDNIEELKKYYHSTKEIELFVNSWAVSELLHYDSECSNDKTLEFAKILQYFWQMRVNEVFPNKNIMVEIGNDIMGEEGITITMYQK